jgi:hypothetical protein
MKNDPHNRKFKTYEKANKFLELRRRHAYRRIELEGDIVLADNSFAGQSWDGDGSYKSFIAIWTKNMVEDIKNFQTPNIYESNNSGK